MKIGRLFSALAGVAFLVATFGSDVVGRVAIGGEAFGQAASKHIYDAITNPILTILLFVPFGVLALSGVLSAEQLGKARSVVLFSVVGTLLIAFYLNGHIGSHSALAEGQWTASALSVGLLPFFATPAVIFLWMVGSSILMRGRGNSNSDVR